MYGQIDGAAVQRSFQFGGEESLAADQRQRLIEDAVALCVQDFDLDHQSWPSCFQECSDEICLPARQR